MDRFRHESRLCLCLRLYRYVPSSWWLILYLVVYSTGFWGLSYSTSYQRQPQFLNHTHFWIYAVPDCGQQSLWVLTRRCEGAHCNLVSLVNIQVAYHEQVDIEELSEAFTSRRGFGFHTCGWEVLPISSKQTWKLRPPWRNSEFWAKIIKHQLWAAIESQIATTNDNINIVGLKKKTILRFPL